MANSTWITSPVGWSLMVIGWWMAPTIGFLLNKLFSYLDFDTSRKLRDLEINTIRDLNQALRDAEEQRMLKEAETKAPQEDKAILLEIMKHLKSALHEAQDILDFVEYHRIKKKVNGGSCIAGFKSFIVAGCKSCIAGFKRFIASFNSYITSLAWWQRLRAAASACISRCKSWYRPLIDISRAALCVRATTIIQGSSADAASSSMEVSVTISDAGSVSGADAVSSAEGASIATAESSVSIVHKLRDWWSSVILPCIIYCGQGLLTCLTNAVAAALYLRDWSNEAFGVKYNQEDRTGLDSFLHIVSRMGLRKRIQQIEDTLADSRKSSLLSPQSTSSENSVRDKIRQIHKSIRPEKVFGRDENRDDICRMLRDVPDTYGASSSNSSRCYSVIGIYGIAGSGKTTLAKYVCTYEEELEDKHFDLVMFIHVSTSFNLRDIFHRMLEEMRDKQLSNDKSPKSEQKKSGEIEELKKQMKGRRFLLVLDDVWASHVENREEVRDLHDVLNRGKSGSGVLVTSQSKDAARALGAQKLIEISELEEEQYFSLLKHHALPVTAGSFDDRKHVVILREIATKLRKSPIAAVTVGEGLAYNLDPDNTQAWERTARRDMLKETRGALWWSYQQLDADIRRCFAYCSIFPRGYKLNRDKLVRMWVAQGFIKSSNEEYDVEDLGQDYVDELIAFSFLQPLQRTAYYWGSEYFTHLDKSCGSEYLTIHDLLHELAERVAGSEFFRIPGLDSPLKDIPPGVRHLFLEINNGAEIEIAEKITDLGNFRTLIIKGCYTDINRKLMHDSEKVLKRLFMRLRKLRVLIVIWRSVGSAVVSVPASIDQMKHLRYLCFDCPYGLDRVSLPSTFSRLYHMQTIDVPSACIVSYPEDMANLICLRHAPGLPNFPNIGRLTSLRTLEWFSVREKPQGYELKQLKDLNKLRDTLKIAGLGIVGSKEEALEADLAGKTEVKKLKLSFSRSWPGDPNADDTEVLEGLCPPKHLFELTIESYQGSWYPSWMLKHPEAPNHLYRLKLIQCRRLLEYIPRAENSEFFSHLCELRIEYADWARLPEYMDRLVSLKNFYIHGCNRIELLPMLPQSLETITISWCRVLGTTCQEEGHQNWHRIQDIPEKLFLGKESLESEEQRTRNLLQLLTNQPLQHQPADWLAKAKRIIE